MRAMAYDSYGEPEVLSVRDLPDPKVGPDYLLVQVAGAGVNPVDAKARAGGLDAAFPSVFPAVPGWDVSGTVVQAGPAAGGFSPGDSVVAYARKDFLGAGTCAELVAVHQRHVAAAPHSVDLVTAGGLPLVGLTALQAIDSVQVTGADTVVVLNASGGVGSMAVQLAAGRGATVIGVCSSRNADYVRGLGAADTVDYNAGPIDEQVRDRTEGGVDAVVDFIGGAALQAAPGMLRSGSDGRFMSVVDPGVLEQGGRYVFVHPDAEGLAGLVDLVDAGRLRLEVEQALPLDRLAEAHERVEAHRTRGKLVIAVR